MKPSKTYFDRSLDKGRLKQRIRWTFENYGAPAAVDLVERLKNLGFRSAAAAGISLGVEDLRIPHEKRRATKRTELVVRFSEVATTRGSNTVAERSQARVQAWARASESRKTAIVDTFRSQDPLSPLYMRAFSGARGNRTQVRQLIGRRGLRVDPLGRLVEFPIRSNFKEGRTLTEFLISCYGARKGIVDTALRTATAGYLTRRLVDVAHYQVIGRLDCGTRRAIRLQPLQTDDGRPLTPLSERLVGRALARPLLGLAPRNTFLTYELAEQATRQGRNPWVRSALSCRASTLGPRPERFLRQRYLSADVRDPAPRLRGFSLCQRCYGWSLADAGLVHLGEAVGILAAQSIGEPGTQLTRRTFHTGGVFSAGGGSVLRAARTGWIHFAKPTKGRLARTRIGRIGFLTRQPGSLCLRDPNGEKRLELDFPSGTLLFVREGQKVLEGFTLGEKPPALVIREGELVVRRNRTNHGGQLVYVDVQEKVPVSKTLDWSTISRTDTFSRIRLLGGEVVSLPKRNETGGSFPFKTGDRVAPSVISSLTSRVAPREWQTENGKSKEQFSFASFSARKSFQKGTYLFRTSQEIFEEFRQKQSWKQEAAALKQAVLFSTPLPLASSSLQNLDGLSLGWILPSKKQSFSSSRVLCLPKYPRSSFLISDPLQAPPKRKRKASPNEVSSSLRSKPILSRAILYNVANFNALKNAPRFPDASSPACSIAKSIQRPQGLQKGSFLQILNKQAPSWLESDIKMVTEAKTNHGTVSFSTLDHAKELQSQVSTTGLLKKPVLQVSYQRLLRSYLPDDLNCLQDAQGFNTRGGRKLAQPLSNLYGLLCLRTNEWGEFAAEQSLPNKQLRQLFIGRRNVGGVKLPILKKVRPIGSYCSPPFHIGGSGGPTWPGQLISYHRGRAVLRRTTDWNLPPESRIRGNSGDLIPRYWPISASRERLVETGDITSGIPRVEALLEARERSGIAPYVQGLFDRFKERGDAPRLAVRKSVHAAQRAIIDSVQRIYRTNGVVIDDKHIELIVRPMGYGEVTRDGAWHEPLARGEIHPIEVLERANQLRGLYNLTKATEERDLYPRIEYQPLILGLTRASLLTTSESFLSAASFQETSRVLARSGVRGRTDYLLGLKENLILGTRLPIGTAARHLLLTPTSLTKGEEKERAFTSDQTLTKVPKNWLVFASNGKNREEFMDRRWNDRPILPKDPSWLDALVYLGETFEREEPLPWLSL